MIAYIDLAECKEVVFPLIYLYLAEDEPAPSYQQEADGIGELEKVLGLVQRDDYYPDFYVKISYVMCSIAGSQYFSNGNKRLAVAVLLIFLMKNKAKILNAKSNELQKLLHDHFPKYKWDKNTNINGAHALFLYNLAIVIGDRNVWGFNDFSKLKEKVESIFSVLYKL